MKKFLYVLCSCAVVFSSVRADEITVVNSAVTHYKKDNITCVGNVAAVYCGRVITADKIIYDRKKQEVTAAGGVIIKDKFYNVCFADEITVDRNFQHGKAKNIKIIMEDRSRLAAETCVIKKGKYHLRNAVYSPCYECSGSGNIAWQIKSQHVLYDPNGAIDYSSAQFEILGTPALYAPYFRHENSKVKRKSGILSPKIATSSSNGLSVMIPYLQAVSDSQEILFKPILTAKAGQVAWAEYNFRFPHGMLSVDSSITGTASLKDAQACGDIPQSKLEEIKHDGFRGHFSAAFSYEISNIWRTGVNVTAVSDQFYLKRFPFLNYPGRTLESNIRLEGFDGDNYTLVKCVKFQTENYDSIPRVFPMFERNYFKDVFRGTFALDIMGMSLDFSESRTSQKIIANASWSKNVFLMFGQILQIKGVLSLRGMRVDEDRKTQYDSACSAVPQVSCIWSWPLLMTWGSFQTAATPIAGIIWAGNSKFQDIFESPFSELNTLNLFSGNRSISVYDIDAGHRICCGIRFSGYRSGRSIYQLIAGQSFELTKTQNQTEASGLKYKNSNIQFGADVFFTKNITWISRGSYCRRTRRWTRIESGIDYQYEKYTASIMAFNGKHCLYNPFCTHIYLQSDEQKTKKYKGLSVEAGYQVAKKVKFTAGFVIGNKAYGDLSSGQCKMIRKKVGMIYKNECTEFHGEIAVNQFRSGDVKPETVFRFSVHLKNLGI